ncbi:MraY family glycosyltransferase [Gryllotalpicola protaetiae]|uniref:Undecaprenyl/decaprenyl-phosphate alpha-N-acetylglucosaminyl 1-phosphate transferase n=1 Tax=Gryllotalpicola protaetiae TaxID=2419771 RepID=A0A387C1M9_9MICO|nr:MraY family glycosyltransferase [Gryllotalpicola protaetiae]AYG04421.1 undecaprenyl/decaprenyl-phosphate alpha-N-acetylglucosaminyl 1-phosphate transferase [Gryllotalpicola protaetiae]
MTLLALLGLFTALVTFGLSLAVYRFALRFKLYPAIRERDVHTRPTPRLGGVAMFLGVLIAFGAAWLFSAHFSLLSIVFNDPKPILGILGGSLLIVVIGVIDDLVDLDWMTKLAGQFVAAGLVAWSGVQILSLPLGGLTVWSPLTSVIITVIVVVLTMNAINFIDGLDGLVVGVAIIANCVFLVYTYSITVRTSPLNYFSLASVITAILIGACVGFLPLNWHPARMFMGDAGALLVGLLMAASAVTVTGQFDPSTLQHVVGRTHLVSAFLPIVLPLAVLIVPFLDFGLAVIRRVNAGRSPMAADRKHLHHRLLDMGHSHFHAVLIFYAWTAVASIGMLLFSFAPVVPVWAAIVFVVVGLLACTAVTLAPLGRRRAVMAAESHIAEPTIRAADASAEAPVAHKEAS